MKEEELSELIRYVANDKNPMYTIFQSDTDLW
jgi:hypothetical protein